MSALLNRARLDFRRDVARWMDAPRHLSFRETAALILTWPGIQAVLLLRAQLAIERAGRLRLARAISMFNLRLTGAEFLLGCRVGPGLVVRHPQGIVIGNGAIIGKDCTLLHRVTLGERYGDGSDPAHGYPHVGDRVVIGAGAVLLGGISVGDGATIGANAVVVRDVLPSDVVVGIPARSTRSTDSGLP